MKDNSAALGFSGTDCVVDAERTIGFCADAFYINDVNILATSPAARRGLSSSDARMRTVRELAAVVDAHQSKLDDLLPAVAGQKRAFELVERIAARIASL
jgi:hypothetical protein